MFIFLICHLGVSITSQKLMLRCFDSCRVIFYLRFVHMFIFSICHLGVSITSQKLMLRCFDSCRVIFYLRFLHMFIFSICHLAVSITLILRLIYLGISSCVYNCVNILVCEITFRKPNTFIFCLCKITFET
jgi:hypothetical protein